MENLNYDELSKKIYEYSIADKESELFTCSDFINHTNILKGVVYSSDFKILLHCFKRNEETIINIPSTVTTISDYAFSNCKNIIEVTFDNGSKLKKIGLGAFSHTTNLELVHIEDLKTLNEIGKLAFYRSGISNICLPRSLKFIGENAFANTKRLLYFNVNNENIKFMSLDGLLYQKKQMKLLKYPSGMNKSTCCIDESTNEIAFDAFDDECTLINVVFPSHINPSDINNLVFREPLMIYSKKAFNIKNNNNKFNEFIKFGVIEYGTTKELDYIVDSDDKVTIVGVSHNSKSKCIIIPSEINQKEVKYIGRNAFLYRKHIEKIYVPDSITDIGDYAFFGINNLEIFSNLDKKPLNWDEHWNLIAFSGYSEWDLMGYDGKKDWNLPNNELDYWAGEFESSPVFSKVKWETEIKC